MLATLILFFGFLLSGIAFLRERSQGTRERLMASPVSRIDILGGYLLGFLLFAVIQTLILFFYSVYVLKVDFHGELWQIILFPNFNRDSGCMPGYLYFGFCSE